MNSHMRTNRSQSARMPFTRIGLAGVVVVSVLFSAAHNVQAAARSQNDYSTLPTSFIANTATITGNVNGNNYTDPDARTDVDKYPDRYPNADNNVDVDP